jgi:hypothetical protein
VASQTGAVGIRLHGSYADAIRDAVGRLGLDADHLDRHAPALGVAGILATVRRDAR